jgi:hypothetical protein
MQITPSGLLMLFGIRARSVMLGRLHPFYGHSLVAEKHRSEGIMITKMASRQ